MLDRIKAFIAEHHVLTLATAQGGAPHAAPLFYAYDAKQNRFLFASDPDTEHGRQMQANPDVSAAIYLETETVGLIKGLQITGTVSEADGSGRQCYLARFPYARVMNPRLWQLAPQQMKLTDNRLGFGKKLIWEAAKGAAR